MQRVYFTSWRSSWLLLACLLTLFCVPAAHAAPPMFVNRTHLDGLGSNYVASISINDTGMYVGTANGLAFSSNGGATFTNRLIASPESTATNWVGDVTAVGEWIYVTTNAGLWMSSDGGQSFSGDPSMRSTYRLHADGTTLYVANISSGLGITDDSGLSVAYRTTANGLGSNTATAPFADGPNVYAGTNAGLSISTDGGATFINRTTANGLGSNTIHDVYARGNRVYAATAAGLSISTDGGATFVNRTVADGLGNNKIWDVYAHGTTVYAATDGGLSISTDGGLSFTNTTTADGLGSNQVFMIAVHGTTLAVATSNGLSIGSTVNANADLSSLTISSGSLNPAFTPGIPSYTTTVANSIASLTITPTTADPAATMTVNGVQLASGSPSSALPLSVGQNSIAILVTAQDQTTKSYTLTVTRTAAVQVELGALVLDVGILTPAFTPETTSYTSSVATDIANMTITPSGADPTLTISINGVIITADTPSITVPLSVGQNTVTIIVTAQNQISKTYTLLVTRSAAPHWLISLPLVIR